MIICHDKQLDTGMKVMFLLQKKGHIMSEYPKKNASDTIVQDRCLAQAEHTAWLAGQDDCIHICRSVNSTVMICMALRVDIGFSTALLHQCQYVVGSMLERHVMHSCQLFHVATRGQFGSPCHQLHWLIQCLQTSAA